MLFVPTNGFFEVKCAFFEVENFGVEESNALIRLSQFRFGELSLCGGLALCRKEVHFRFGLFGEREDALGNLGVDVSSCEFLEERTLVGVAGFEEVGKAVLCQDDGARKLRIVQSHRLFDGLLSLGDAAGDERELSAVGDGAERAFGFVEMAVAVHAHFPLRFVAFAARIDKSDACPSLVGAFSEERTGVLRRKFGQIFCGVFALVLRKSLHVFESWGFAVECQTHCVEECAFAGSRVAGDGKKSGRPERFGGEVDGMCACKRGEVVQGDEFDGHAGVYLSMELTAMLNLSTSASGISLP